MRQSLTVKAKQPLHKDAHLEIRPTSASLLQSPLQTTYMCWCQVRQDLEQGKLGKPGYDTALRPLVICPALGASRSQSRPCPSLEDQLDPRVQGHD